MMLHTKYQGCRPCGFREEEDFSCFLYISLCKTCDRGGGGGGGGGGHSWPQGHKWNKFGW